MTTTVEDADPVNDNTFSAFTEDGVDVDNRDAEVLGSEVISQQEEKYETSTDKVETTVWTDDKETAKTSQIKLKQVKTRRGSE